MDQPSAIFEVLGVDISPEFMFVESYLEKKIKEEKEEYSDNNDNDMESDLDSEDSDID